MKSIILTPKVERICQFVSLVAAYFLSITPLFFGNIFFGYVSAKMVYINALCQIIFICWVILAILYKKYRPKLNLISLALGIYVLVLILSSIFGSNPTNSFWSNFARSTGTILIIHLFLFFCAAQAMFDKKVWHELIGIAAVVGALISMTIILGMLGIFNKSQATDYGTMGNSSFLATYLLFALFFAVYLGWSKEPKIRKMWVLEENDIKFTLKLSAFIIIFGLALSTGRAAATASLIGLLLVFLFYRAYGNPDFKTKKIFKVTLFIILAGILCAAIGLNIPNSFVQKQFSKIASVNRPVVWQISWQVAKERPLLGWGPENFETAFAKKVSPKLFLVSNGIEYRFDRAHSVFWDHLVETGFIGLVSYIILMASVFFVLCKKFLKTQNNIWLVAVFVCLLISYILQNLTVFDTPTSYFFFFFVLAFLASSAREEFEEQKTAAINNFQVAGVMISAMILPLCLTVFVIRPYQSAFFAAKAVKSEQTFEEKFQNFQRSSHYSVWGRRQLREHFALDIQNGFKDKKFSAANLEIALAELQKTRVDTPDDFYNLMNMAKISLDLGDLDKKYFMIAQDILNDAKNINPQNIYYLSYLIDLKIAQKDYRSALEVCGQSIKLEPKIPLFHKKALEAAKLINDKKLIEKYSQELNNFSKN